MYRFRWTKHLIASCALSAVFTFGLSIPQAIAADPPVVEAVPQPSFDPARFGNEPKEKQWSLIVGGGGIYEPTYEGGDEFEVSPVPFVVFTWGDWLEIDPRGITVTALEQNGFSIAGKVGYETGRDEKDDDRLRGLGDIDFAATVGAKVAYDWRGFEVYAAIDQTIEGSESLIGTLGVDYQAPVTERLFLGAGAKATFANAEHMQTYFGITARQSAESGLPEYKADAGLKRIDMSVSATYMLSQNWLVRGEAGVGFLTGHAADSPVVSKKTQPSGSLFVGYKF